MSWGRVDRWSYVVRLRSKCWELTLYEDDQVQQLQLFPLGQAGQDEADDAGFEWIYSDERGMGLHSPMEAAGGSSHT